jgi:hypothetical protein
MPLPELRRTLWNQAPQSRLSRRKISLENISNTRDATNPLAGRIKNMRIRLAKKHTQISITKMRDKVGCISTCPQERHHSRRSSHLPWWRRYQAPYPSYHPQKSHTLCVTGLWGWRTISCFWSCVMSNRNPWAMCPPSLHPSPTQDEKGSMAQCWG